MDTKKVQNQESINDVGNKEIGWNNERNHVEFNSNLFIIHEDDDIFSEVEIGENDETQRMKDVVSPNFQLDSATRKIANLLIL